MSQNLSQLKLNLTWVKISDSSDSNFQPYPRRRQMCHSFFFIWPYSSLYQHFVFFPPNRGSRPCENLSYRQAENGTCGETPVIQAGPLIGISHYAEGNQRGMGPPSTRIKLAPQKINCEDNASFFCSFNAMTVCFAGKVAGLKQQKQEMTTSQWTSSFSSLAVEGAFILGGKMQARDSQFPTMAAGDVTCLQTK